MTGSERRTTQRFSMRLPLTVRWTTGAAVGETSTESRDVSSRGVYFFLQKDVKEGSPVEILLTLPNEITLAGPVRVRCLGRVQRTESRDEGAVGVVAEAIGDAGAVDVARRCRDADQRVRGGAFGDSIGGAVGVRRC